MPFINWTETIGIAVGNAAQTTFGSILFTLMIIMLILFAVAIMFGIPLEYTAIIYLPLVLGYSAYYSEYLAIGITILIYVALIFTKKFLFR